MKFKGCIFDLDGVIVDTAKYHYLAWKKLADDLDIEFTEKDNERLKGVSRAKSLEIVLEKSKTSFTEEEKIKIAEKKNKLYVEYIQNLTENEILEGVKDFLKQLRENKIKIALGSASKNAMTILKKLNIEQLFDVVIDGTKVSKAKPDPEVFIKGAEELGLSPKECIVFEDAFAGIDAAKNAEMYAVGIGNNEILFNADIVIKGLKDINIDILMSI